MLAVEASLGGLDWAKRPSRVLLRGLDRLNEMHVMRLQSKLQLDCWRFSPYIHQVHPQLSYIIDHIIPSSLGVSASVWG